MARKRRRRIWEDEEKRRIVAQTRVPGVSVSQVARRYDVNANMVFKWLRDPRFKPPEDELPSFLPVEVLPDASPGAALADEPDLKSEKTLAGQCWPSAKAPWPASAIWGALAPRWRCVTRHLDPE